MKGIFTKLGVLAVVAVWLSISCGSTPDLRMESAGGNDLPMVLTDEAKGSGGGSAPPALIISSPGLVNSLNELNTSPFLESLSLLDFSTRMTHSPAGYLNRSPLMVEGDQPSPVLSDGEFVWGPNAEGFSVAEALSDRESPLAPFSDDLALWASYTSVNPRVLLTVLEVQDRLISEPHPDWAAEEIKTRISQTALSLAKAYYQHMYSVGVRSGNGSKAAAVVETADGGVLQVDPRIPSGSYAVAAVLGQRLSVADLQSALSSNARMSFPRVYGALFPESDPLSTSNDVSALTVPPTSLLQLPFPQGAVWTFGGPHSWNGDNTPPFSSMDFFLRGGTCAAPPFYYATASAAGSSQRPSNYSCWLEINHGGGWKTSYYHLRYTYTGSSIDRNGVVGSIACETCAGGWASGPHVHWSLKYNGSYVSLEGAVLSGWKVHVGSTAYSTGSLTRDGVTLDPYDSVLNDYHTYYPLNEHSLRFFGNGTNDIDRVKVQVDNPSNSIPGPPVDVGASDFTFEWWMKAPPGENNAGPITCGWNYHWIYGNTIFDRDRYNQVRTYGISMADGKIAFGLTGNYTGSYTLCGTSRVNDGQWHHIAVERRRSDGYLWLYVDGRLEAKADGPDGDISYPDNGTPDSYCGPTGDEVCVNDPYLVIGAEKHGVGPGFPSYSGWLDEIRVSNILRYGANFTRPNSPFTTDASTVGLYHFDEGAGDSLNDVSGYPGGPGNGKRFYGGSPAGPVWSTDNPWTATAPSPYRIFFPIVGK